MSGCKQALSEVITSLCKWVRHEIVTGLEQVLRAFPSKSMLSHLFEGQVHRPDVVRIAIEGDISSAVFFRAPVQLGIVLDYRNIVQQQRGVFDQSTILYETAAINEWSQ